ncbi:UDP-N-acetylmuramoyl-L-alanyl-D-glutamate--2,6-diaminopimelate ligase [Nocardioides salsibiostraticola]
MSQTPPVTSTRPRRVHARSVRALLPDARLARTGSAQEEVLVSGISLDSRRIEPGDLYAALPGAAAHGADFVSQAVDNGAVAVLTDPEGVTRIGSLDDLAVPVLVLDDPRAGLGELAAEVYQRPASSMATIGITGTQGKTTTTLLAEGGLEVAGIPAAAIGTVGTRIAGQAVQTSLTTPEAPDLQGLFAVMREQEVAVCVMEVSSHALVLGRVDGIVFDVAVFLNLGRDHLDFHTDVEDYYAAKASLFTPERSRRAVIDIDTEFGARLAQEATVPVRTLSTRRPDADWTVSEVRLEATGSSFLVHGAGEPIAVRCPLPGDFNVANALAAIAGCAEAGLDPRRVAEGISQGGGVPGRLERIEAGQDFAVVVDYAHKPDAVGAALATLRPLTDGQLIIVLGAGGDRDAGKRPLMAAIAAEHADVLLVTDDNPRTEDPAAIRAQMLAGIDGVEQPTARVIEVGDRRAAINQAIAIARTGDIVIIAGKGHETGQMIGAVTHPFDDRVVAREALLAREGQVHDD